MIIVALVSIASTFAVVTFGTCGTPKDIQDPSESGQAALRAIRLLVESASQDCAIPRTQAPFSSDSLSFSSKGTASRIWMETSKNGNRVVWDGIELCHVTPMLEGEEANGMDDNGNGLIDEQGLCFVVDGKTVTVRLTAESRGACVPTVQTMETTIALPEFAHGGEAGDVDLAEAK